MALHGLLLFLNEHLLIALESKLDVTENGTNGCVGILYCIHAAVSSVCMNSLEYKESTGCENRE
jgi:hypothetical protein